jgi:uncharacterized tannase-like protein DUF6351
MALRTTVVVALASAGLLGAGVSAVAAEAGRHGALRLEVLSGPAQYVSGGTARIRVVVPASVPLDDAMVSLNGANVTAVFVPDNRAEHALEGVLRGLPPGVSSVEARVPGRGWSPSHRTSLRLVNHPITGPMFSGPQQPDFFCSTPAHLAGFDLTGPFLDANCSLATQVGYYYRSTAGAWRPYDPAAPRPPDMTQTTTSEGATVDFVIRWERGTINRFIYTIAVLDPGVSGPSVLPHWNGKLIYYFGGGVAIGQY